MRKRWIVFLAALAFLQVSASFASSAQGAAQWPAPTSISYDELILIGTCPFSCKSVPTPGSFNRDWVAYEQWSHSRHDYLPGQTYHLEYLGDWGRVDNPYTHIASICNRRTNDFVALDMGAHTYLHSPSFARMWFGTHGCGHRLLGMSLIFGARRLQRDSSAIALKPVVIDGIPAKGRAAYFRAYDRLPMKDAPLEEASLYTIRYVAPFDEPCPPVDSPDSQKNFDFCDRKIHSPFVLFVQVSSSPVPGIPNAIAVNGRVITVERGHIRNLTQVDLRDFSIPATFRNACSKGHAKSGLSYYCRMESKS